MEESPPLGDLDSLDEREREVVLILARPVVRTQRMMDWIASVLAPSASFPTEHAPLREPHLFRWTRFVQSASFIAELLQSK